MLKKTLHIVIASLILVSSTGFTINLHYCHDQLYDLALFSPAHSCCGADAEGLCHSSEGLSSKSHCEDESIAVESTDDFMVSSYTFNFENTHNTELLLTAQILYYFQGSDDYTAMEAPWYKKPPPIQEVVLSQIQSFLI